MGETKTHKTSLLLTAMFQKMHAKSVMVNSTDVTLTSSTYTRKSSSLQKLIIPTDFVMVEPSILQSLTPGAQKLAIRIMKELKKNNQLWHFDYRLKRRMEENISELRRLKVIYKTDETTMHLVNPWLIRRGAIDVAIAATLVLVGQSKAMSKLLIKNLKPANQAATNGYYQLMADDESLNIEL